MYLTFGTKNEKVGFFDKRFYSIDEYLEIESQLSEVYEFWNGDIIKLNQFDYSFFKQRIFELEKLLSEQSKEKEYKLFSNLSLKKKKVWIEKENSLLYLDLFVIKGEIEYFSGRKDIIVNPSMLVEVSTAASMGFIDNVRGDQTFLKDRTKKFWKYQKLNSLREYVLVSDAGFTVFETYNRLEKESWKYQMFSEDENDLVHFESIDSKIPFKDIYL